MTKKQNDSDPDDTGEPLEGIGAVFRGLGSFVELLGNLVDQGESLQRHGSFKPKGLGDKAQGMYGFSIRTGAGGTPEIRRFGNLRRTPDGPVVSDVREPLVDVFDEGSEVVVIVELPGVGEHEVTLNVVGSVLSLMTTGLRRYVKLVHLPAQVNSDSLTQSFRNGILQIKIRKS
jgi:HSP20 family protein